jgi:hypothetical protein
VQTKQEERLHENQEDEEWLPVPEVAYIGDRRGEKTGAFTPWPAIFEAALPTPSNGRFDMQFRRDKNQVVPHLGGASNAPPSAGHVPVQPDRSGHGFGSPEAGLADVASAIATASGNLPMDFFAYTPNTVVLGCGQSVELHPPAEMIAAGMVFAVAPELPLGLALDRSSGCIHGIAQQPTHGPGTYFVTACAARSAIKTVKVSVVNIKVIKVQAPGYTMTSVMQPEPGLTLIALREDSSLHAQQHLPAQLHPQLPASRSGAEQRAMANWWTQNTTGMYDQVPHMARLQALQILQQSMGARSSADRMESAMWGPAGNL